LIGKICVRLAAGDAPVAVKRKAVEPLNKFERTICILLYMNVKRTLLIQENDINE
jgi:hypothetical protein